ncbi:AAA family ATPase [Streptomyces sp. NPDC086182]|jgi:predicted kinase|uniref:AAA family ATPase n=1 Tax=Streptomyces sp. NPDC086182 TaxID=3155058 RepID=UPI00341333AE
MSVRTRKRNLIIIWINGPFGGGKTTLATQLHQHLDGAITTDPEEVGFLLRKSIGDHPDRQKDFQDYAMWRELVARVCTELDRFAHGGPVIAPMTLLRREYADDIFDALHKDGIEVRHLLVHAGSDTIRARIESSMEFPGDEERSERVRAFRRRKLADYEQAYATWLGERADVIDSTALSPDQVAAQALSLLRLP